MGEVPTRFDDAASPVWQANATDPSWTGGTLSYIDFMGTKKFVELCHKFEAKYGSRFTPPKLLVEMAAKGETFYGRFPPKKLATSQAAE